MVDGVDLVNYYDVAVGAGAAKCVVFVEYQNTNDLNMKLYVVDEKGEEEEEDESQNILVRKMV